MIIEPALPVTIKIHNEDIENWVEKEIQDRIKEGIGIERTTRLFFNSQNNRKN